MPEIWPGQPSPLGANWDGRGVNFALYSENAEAVELCFFADSADARASQVFTLTQRTRNTWHAYIPRCEPGQLYGYRVYGRYDPWVGLRFNPAKLLVDPYARALTGSVQWNAGSPFAYPLGQGDGDLVRDDTESAGAVPKSIVVNPRFNWGDDRPPARPLQSSVIYELHVKGFTARFPGLEAKKRGTYAGLASSPVVEYLKKLGVTAVELMPVHHCQPEKTLLDRGLTNYWGYNTLGYFAPDARYSASGSLGSQVDEFKRMVKALHAAGIEVILDVVYNHTCEGNHLGPTLSWRGIDNPTYYCLEPGQLRYYRDYTGCGNSLNMRHPTVLRMIADSLRYWVLEMHVDGFRFDLASVLAREGGGPDRLASFFDIVHQDPVLNHVKLIAEPWDVSLGGYQVGGFPVDWSEWNGRYRDTVRRFWKGDHGLLSDVAYRLTGSSDLYRDDGRSPSASVNFITCHDGFTLHDLVSYNHKHNDANLEDNRDGADSNDSWNCGAEGDTREADVLELRARQMRNFLATLFLSQGTPMLWSGDEFANTQRGNNNAYCQDNEIGWLDWKWAHEHADQLEFARGLIAFRAAHPVFRRSRFFEGRDFSLDQIKDITWLRPNGQEMRHEDWATGWAQCVGMQLDGGDLPDMDEHGAPLRDGVFVLLLNAYYGAVEFTLPPPRSTGAWHLRFDTSRGWVASSGPSPVALAPSTAYSLSARSMALLEWGATRE